MDYKISRDQIETSRKMVSDDEYIPLYHEKCMEKTKSGELGVCYECQKIIGLKSILSTMADNLVHSIERMEASDLCLCQKRGKDIVCQYDEMFKIGDAFFDVINSKYINLIDDYYWLMEEGRVEEANENKKAVDKIFKAIDDYAEFRTNKFHGYQRLPEQ